MDVTVRLMVVVVVVIVVTVMVVVVLLGYCWAARFTNIYLMA